MQVPAIANKLCASDKKQPHTSAFTTSITDRLFSVPGRRVVQESLVVSAVIKHKKERTYPSTPRYGRH